MSSETPDHDEISGVATTGHDWDGIRELNNPAPRWWLIIFLVTVIWAIGYWIVYPVVVTPRGETSGTLGWSSARQLKESQADIIARRARNAKDFDRLSLDAIRANPGLYRFAQAGGQALFKENCAPCHGSGAAGRTGYPNLNDDDWLWGGTLQDVYKTIQHGIRAKDEQTRSNVMPNFGADGILPPADVDLVSTYVLSLSEPSTPMTPAQREAGSKLFADNCASCHGAKGEGLPEMGGPRLSDKIWLYGSGKEAIARQVNKARAGVMPSWSQRLPDSSIKQLAIYIDSLGGTRKAAAAGAPATGPVAEKTAAQ